MANTSSALMAQQPTLLQLPEPPRPQIKIEEVVEDEEKVTLDLKDVEDEEYYTLEELDEMENKTMAYMARKFSNVRLRKNKPFQSKFQGFKNGKLGVSRTGASGSGTGYRT